MAENPDFTIIPDKAEVWIALASTVASVSAMIPSTADADLAALKWLHVGLIDADKGIPLDPSGEVKEYDAFGRPAFRYKFKKGKLKSGFTVFEDNDVTRQIGLVGSAANKIGPPKNIQAYVLYKFVDLDVPGGARVWVSLRPALAELKDSSGIKDGDVWYSEYTIHHSPDANGDIFQLVGGTLSATKTITLGSGVTAYTVTVDGQATASITTLTGAGLQTALRALSNVGASGVTVTGTSSPFTAVFSTAPKVITAAGTGGTVTVA